MFTGVEGDQRRGEKFRGWREGRWDGEWLDMEKEFANDGGSRGRAPWLARIPPKAGLAASIIIK